MAGGVPPPAQLVADLPGFQGKPRLQGVQQAGFPYARIPCKGTYLASDQLPELVYALPGFRADAHSQIPSVSVDSRQLLPGTQVGLVDTHQTLTALCLRRGNEAVDQKRVSHRIDQGGQNHHQVDIGHHRAVELVLPA